MKANLLTLLHHLTAIARNANAGESLERERAELVAALELCAEFNLADEDILQLVLREAARDSAIARAVDAQLDAARINELLDANAALVGGLADRREAAIALARALLALLIALAVQGALAAVTGGLASGKDTNVG